MRSTLVSICALALGLLGLVLLVDFLGLPVPAAPLEQSVAFRPMDAAGGLPPRDGEGAATGSAVSGRVLDGQGQPIAGVRVIATDVRRIERRTQAHSRGPESPLAETRSDEAGHFELEGLSPGFIRVWAGSESWLYGWTQRVEVRPEQESYNLVLTLERSPSGPLAAPGAARD